MADTTIKAMNPLLGWLVDMLSYYQAEAVKIPSTYREKVLAVKAMLNDESSGLVNSMLDFAINGALVSYRIETGNENLTELLNNWLASINADLRGKIPTGLSALAKEYFRERWKGSSNILLRTFWTNKDGLELPNTLFFVDGEDIKVTSNSKDGVVRLGDESYYIRVSNNYKYNEIDKKDIRLPRDKNELIFAQKPFEAWGVREPVPYLIKRGIYRNCSFMKLLSQKGESIVSKAIEYLFILKKGTERLHLDGNTTYSKEELQQASQDLKDIVNSKKSSDGALTYTTNFDTDVSDYIPDYQKAINSAMYSVIEKRILAGLGMVDIVEGSASTRRESILNPKPFMSEVEQGISDFKSLLNDIIQVIVEKNIDTHKKWMGAKIQIISSPVKMFVDDKVQSMLRSIYDRGSLSKRTLVEIMGLDFDLEVKRREQEKIEHLDEKLYPPVIQNQESSEDEIDKTDNEEKTLDDRKSIEKKNFNASSDEKVFEEAPYKTNKDLPEQLDVLPPAAKTLWRKVFNQSYPKGEDYARKVAWDVVKQTYKKSGDKWVKKSKGEVEESFKGMSTDELVELKKLEVLGKQEQILNKLLAESDDATT